MSKMLSSSHGLVLATAMAVSAAGTLILFDILRVKHSPTTNSDHGKQFLRSCLSSGDKKIEGKNKKKKKKKKVHFADDVKDSNGNGEEYRKKHKINRLSRYKSNFCGSDFLDQIHNMPANHVALYSGMLKDRSLQKMEYSF